MITETLDRARRAIHDATADEPTSILKGALAGAAAGLIAALVMDGVERILLSPTTPGEQPGHEPDLIPAYTPEAQASAFSPSGDPQDDSTGGESATQRTATAVADVVGAQLTKRQREAGGVAVHLGFGASVGALYGALAEFTPINIGLGLPYGAAVWLLADEATLSLLGLERRPTQREPGEHALSFLLHLVYGSTLDLLRRGIRTLL